MRKVSTEKGVSLSLGKNFKTFSPDCNGAYQRIRKIFGNWNRALFEYNRAIFETENPAEDKVENAL